MNVWLDVSGRRFQVDCLWRAQRLVIELDGHQTHRTTGAFERDRERDRLLQTAGLRVVRITWRQLQEQAEVLAADLSLLLAPQYSSRYSSSSQSVTWSAKRCSS